MDLPHTQNSSELSEADLIAQALRQIEQDSSYVAPELLDPSRASREPPPPAPMTAAPTPAAPVHDTQADLNRAGAEAVAQQEAADAFRYDDPFDIWDIFAPPVLPVGLLPYKLEKFAKVKARIQGSSEEGFAIGGLVTCANVINKDIRIKVKRHDNWYERCCLWAGLVGKPSVKKTPIISELKKPVVKIEARLRKDFMELWADYKNRLQSWNDDDKKTRGAKPEAPLQKRILVEDTTTEALQEIQLTSTDRLFCLRDELSGHFAAIDQYKDKTGDAPGKAYWLEAFNGNGFMLDRIVRGMGRYIECNMVGLLGGIQPDKIRDMMQNASDDGTIQRLIPIMLPPSDIDRDEPDDGASKEFGELVDKLHSIELCHIEGGGAFIFSEEAHRVREEFFLWCDGLKHIEAIDSKLASHIGKYSGIYARICLAVHLIDHCSMVAGHLEPAGISREIQGDVAIRVAQLMKKFLLPHAVAFYREVVAGSKAQGILERVASSILANGLRKCSPRDFRGTKIDPDLIPPTLKRLEVFGWLQAIPGPRSDSPVHYRVNEVCHEKLKNRVEESKKRQELAMSALRRAREGA